MDTERTTPRSPLSLKIAAALAALLIVPGGAFLLAANIGTGGKTAIGAAVVWWVVAGAVIGRTVLRRRPDLKRPVRVPLVAAAIASVVAAYVVTRDREVNERIVTGEAVAEASEAEREAALGGEAKVPEAEKPKAGAERTERKAAKSRSNVRLLSGSFSGESGHAGSGKAAVVKLASGGRMLTFSDFDVDPGAGGLRVYLHAGRTTSDDLGDFVEIAGLKGNVGDQQYRIPAGVDLGRYSTVVIWCVPFTTRIAQAPLG